MPDDLPLKSAVMVEPIAACLIAMVRAGVSAGQRKCVVGAGPQGSLCVQLLHRAGVSVEVVDPDERRLNLVQKLEIDTHTELLAEARYDFCFVTRGRNLPTASEASASAAATVRVVCGGHRQDGADGAEGEDSDRASWKKAVRPVRAGSLDLSDHTAIVEPLAAYASAWGAQAAGRHFKAILNADLQLSDL